MSLVRRVRRAAWTDLGDGVLRFEIEATAFCHQMVRSIVGTMVAAGRAEVRAGDIRGILRLGPALGGRADRPARGPVPLARGLLSRVRLRWELREPDGDELLDERAAGAASSTAKCRVPLEPPYPATSSASSGSTVPLCGK